MPVRDRNEGGFYSKVFLNLFSSKENKVTIKIFN